MTHHLDGIVREGSERYVARCTCGERMPVVSDRRTAAQAHRHHATEAGG